MTAHPNKIEEENCIQPEGMSFWEHLDELRASLIKIIIATIACSIIAFLFKDEVFSIILAPKNDHFITYRLLNMINRWATGMDSTGFSVSLINTGLAEQFIIHMKTSLYTGLLLSSPYILYILFHFISPALYSHERKYSVRVAGGGYIMFMAGFAELLSYFSPYFPLFGYLSSQYGSNQHDFPTILYGYFTNDEPVDGNSVRTSCNMLVNGKIGSTLRFFHATFPKALHYCHSHYRCHHYSYIRCVYTYTGQFPYLDFV